MERRIHVLGNAGADILLRVPRMPADGETLIARSSHRAPGGKGLNQAVVAARAGAVVRFIAPVGADGDADMVRAHLAREPICEVVLWACALPTDLSVVTVDDAGDNRIVSTSLCADTITPADAAAVARDVRAKDVFVMQGNLSREAIMAAAVAADALGATVLLNLAPYRWEAGSEMPPCLLVVNAVEAAQASGVDDPAAAAASLLRAGARGVIVTLGAAGCLVASGGESARKFAAARARVVDTTGAGDTFCGVVAAGLARGDDIFRAIGWAQRAAAVSVSRAGAYDALPTAAELAESSK